MEETRGEAFSLPAKAYPQIQNSFLLLEGRMPCSQPCPRQTHLPWRNVSEFYLQREQLLGRSSLTSDTS